MAAARKHPKPDKKADAAETGREAASEADVPEWDLREPAAYLNRELSFLAFASRVLAMAEDPEVPLLERVKFAGIIGMLHDEFAMKRLSGLKRKVAQGREDLSPDGRTPAQELQACREVMAGQAARLAVAAGEQLRPALAREGLPLYDWDDLGDKAHKALRESFSRSYLPILTPLAVDSEHPFPFISNQGLNLAVARIGKGGRIKRFVRVKVPSNRPRWVPVPDRVGWVPLEQVIAHNIDLLVPKSDGLEVHLFRVTRGMEADDHAVDEDELDGAAVASDTPGSIVMAVSNDLKARRFAGVVRVEVDADMPAPLVAWLAEQLGIGAEDVQRVTGLLSLADFSQLDPDDRPDLRFPRHEPVTHPRMEGRLADPAAMFAEVRRGDILVHHPYQRFDTSVLQFIRAAALDPAVLAIKLTIYRTSRSSPIVEALLEAARQGKQVAVLVEITARFDEAPNIEWGKRLEQEGAHVAYGVERLKTHVKLALVVREEGGELRRYAHIGTGNYHSGTARIYEDLGMFTADADLCEDVAQVFNELTGSLAYEDYEHLLVAPRSMRKRFVELIRREAEHAQAGRPAGIYAKMNQLQDPAIIRELYRASQAGVPITLNVRGLCCLRPGVPGLSASIRVYGIIGRFLEHSRVYRFENAGAPELYMGSADWMKRNLSNRVETIAPVRDAAVKAQIEEIIAAYEADNASAWDCDDEGCYTRRRPGPGETPRPVQEVLIRRALEGAGNGGSVQR